MQTTYRRISFEPSYRLRRCMRRRSERVPDDAWLPPDGRMSVRNGGATQQQQQQQQLTKGPGLVGFGFHLAATISRLVTCFGERIL
ncbi:hypothetical protein AND_004662 [Anopheles darlingi]|uniref:Uncharacterized protein n=1 Tax=Anopheles darlingi TaxID=43151 RepID=W5JL29_ANODA|nr:hypothetical protein AND_004662 [Anopheles darlingi]